MSSVAIVIENQGHALSPINQIAFAMTFAALDFETTGYENGNTNEPWQLGISLVEDGVITTTHEWFFNRGKSLMDQWNEFFPLLNRKILVAHNISTEKNLLTRLAPLTKWGPWVDTLKLAKARYPKLPSYQLGDLCGTFGCIPVPDDFHTPDISTRTWHDALFDAVACARLALILGA